MITRADYSLSTLALAGIFAMGAAGKIPAHNPFRSDLPARMSKELKELPGIKIYFSGNVAGSNESCGCAINPKGGFERRLNFLKRAGSVGPVANTLVLDFGNLLFKIPDVRPEQKNEALAGARKMIDGTNLFGYTAVNFGWLDRSVPTKDLGPLLAKAKFPWVASNVLAAGRFAAGFRRRIPVKLQNAEVVIFGLSSATDNLAADGWQFQKPADALAKELKDLPASTIPIVLSDLEMSELMPLAASVKRPIIFLGSREVGGWDRPIRAGHALLLHLRHQGQDWGVLQIPAKWDRKQSWFRPEDAAPFAQRWDELIKDAAVVRESPPSSAKSKEVEKVQAQIVELAAQAPADSDIPYRYEAIEIGDTYDGHNEASKFTK